MTRMFRLYLMDEFSGHIVYARDLIALDESGAVLDAEQVPWRGPIELWEGNQKLHRLEKGR